MKQIVVISGKGGTGKSTIVASLAKLVEHGMLADCDVDAPNLHLLFPGKSLLRRTYSGTKVARINADRCTTCGRCREVCRFNAIDENFVVKSLACEGCAACLVVCPAEAIDLMDETTGEVSVDQTDVGIFAHARLAIGAEGSGKLVTEVRKNCFEFHQDEPILLIDGSPGIGCVVIASITGTDAVLCVTEPTPSGFQDLDRVLQVARHFQVPAMVCVNKFDLNLAQTAAIEAYCSTEGVPVLAKIPFDPAVVKALQNGMSPVDAGLTTIVEPIQHMWQALMAHLTTSPLPSASS
jgi:MinD superfamily P-loop ATPase